MFRYKLNKKIFISFIALLVLGASYAVYSVYAAGVVMVGGAQPKAVASSIQKGLVGYWPLDGDNYNATTARVGDETPYGNHGTNYGATLTTDRNGQSNGAMSFDGVNDYVGCGNALSLKSAQGTLSFWIKPLDFVGGRGVFHTYQISNQDYLRSYIYPTGIIDLVIEDDNLGKVSLRSLNALPVNTFTHVTWAQDGVAIKLYLNGIEAPIEGTNSGAWWTNHLTSFNTIIGSAWAAFNGSISDVRIYNRALSVDEVSMLYNSNKPKVVSDSLQKGLVLDMPLTSTYTKTVTAGSQIMVDKTPYGNNGQNSGATVGADSTNFDGAGNYVNVGSGSALNFDTNDFTISVWAKAVSGQSGRGIINRGGWSSIGYAISEAYSPANRYYFVLNSSSGRTEIALPLFETWDWTHIVGVKKTDYFEVWINGVNVGSRSGTIGSLSNPAKNFEIGRSFNPSYFNGSISGVKIYNRALSATEVKSLFEKGRQ